MKFLPKFMLLALLILSVFLFCACDSSAEKPEAGTGEAGLTENADGTLTLTVPTAGGAVSVTVERRAADAFAGYTVIRPDQASEGEIAGAKAIYNAAGTLASLSLSTDWVNRGEEVPADGTEFVVGLTNRPGTPSDLRSHDYAILASGSRILICGGSGAASEEAANLFASYFVDTETGSILVPTGDGLRVNGSYLCDVLNVNGTPLADYSVTLDRAELKNAKPAIERFVSDTTGLVMNGKSDRKIILTIGETDALCEIRPEGNDLRVVCTAENAGLAARYFISAVTAAGAISPDKTAQTADITLSASALTPDSLAKAEPVRIFVAPDGNDETGNGSMDAPYATLSAARERARILGGQNLAPVEISLRGGDYYFTSGVNFDETDSGSPYLPLTIAAYNGEKVRFFGGIHLDASRAVPAADAEIVGRVLDGDTAAKLMQIDLSDLVENFPAFYSYGHTEDNANMPMEVYIGGAALSRSRYPNNIPGSAYLRTDSNVISNSDGTKTITLGRDAIEHIALWSDKATEDLYLFGFLSWDWSNETYDASMTDLEHGTVRLPGGLNNYFNSITGGTRYYFFNLPEEIDMPGECFVDHKNRIVYFCPPENMDTAEMYVSTLTDTMLKFDGTNHVVVEGIEFLYTRGKAIEASGCTDFTFRNCDVMHTSSNAGSFNGTNITVSGCHVYDTSSGGFNVGGGDRATLTSSHNLVENCEIHSVNRDQSTYKPAVLANAFDMTVKNNLFYDGVHEMVHVGNNDIIIEYNEFYNCVTESSDMGAIYFGRDPALMGTVIRYNYFHDIGNPYGGVGQQSIFIDDGNNGADIYGNLFVRGTVDDAPIKTHGAQFSQMKYNIFVDAPAAYRNTDWCNARNEASQKRWMMWLFDRDGSGHNILSKIQSANYDSPAWHEHYDGTIWGQLYEHIDAEKIADYTAMEQTEFEKYMEKIAPQKTNILSENIMVNIKAGPKFTYIGGKCVYENNFVTDDTSIFKAYGTDFTLTDEALAEIRETIPGFEQIPLDKIGPQK